MNKYDTNSEYIKLTKPSYLMSISNYFMPIVFVAAIIFVFIGLYMGLVIAKTDIQQGENYRIVYIHVPAAWASILLYLILTISSALYLIVKHPLSTIVAHASSKIGALFTFITLVTGSLWGYPTWGTFWVWDARLTSVLILLFIYLTHLIVITNKEYSDRANKIAAILAVIGFINIPIIKYSVDWWTTLHQGASVTQFKSSIDTTILYPMFIIFISFMLFSIYIITCNTKRDIYNKKIILLKIKHKQAH